jgi:hypothetical protein
MFYQKKILKSYKRKKTNEDIGHSNVATTSRETQSDCFSGSDDDQDYTIEAKRFKNDTKM